MSGLSKLFSTANILRLQKIWKEHMKTILSVGGLSLLSLSLVVLSTVSIGDVEAIYSENSDFKISIVTNSSVMYEEDELIVSLFLTNISNETQFVTFTGQCQATFRIYDEEDKLVYPQFVEDTPCNNVGYEEFLIYPQDQKRYSFRLLRDKNRPLTLTTGKYKVVGTIHGFGDTDVRNLEILKRPKTSVGNGELCEGLTAKQCDTGLECKFRGGFPGGSGMCMPIDDNFEPKNYCVSGLNRCYRDETDRRHQILVDKFVTTNRIEFSKEDGAEIEMESPVTQEQISEIINKSSRNKKIELGSGKITRAEAVMRLYKYYIKDHSPKIIDRSPYKDTYGNPYENFIIASYQLGVLSLNQNEEFSPNQYLNQIDALELIDRFENSGY